MFVVLLQAAWLDCTPHGKAISAPYYCTTPLRCACPVSSLAPPHGERRPSFVCAAVAPKTRHLNRLRSAAAVAAAAKARLPPSELRRGARCVAIFLALRRNVIPVPSTSFTS